MNIKNRRFKKISIALPDDLKNYADQLCTKVDLNFSQYIRYLLREAKDAALEAQIYKKSRDSTEIERMREKERELQKKNEKVIRTRKVRGKGK